MLNPILNTGTYKELKGLLSEGGGPLFLSGAVDSVKAMLSAALSASGWGMLVLSSEQRAKSFLRELRSLTEQSFYYPAKDLLFYQADTQGTLITRQRVEALSHLTEDESGILVTTIDALMDKIWDRESFQGAVLRLAPGQIHELSALSKKLTSLGYQRLPAVEAMGEYSLRGGILDIYPFTAENPIRLEFWGDEIDNIRSFDLLSQRSVEKLDEAEICPAAERGCGRKGDASLLDYLPEHARIFLDEPVRLRERGRMVEAEFSESCLARADSDSPFPREEEGVDSDPAELIYSADSVMERLYSGRSLSFSTLGNNLEALSGGKEARTLSFPSAEIESYRSRFDYLIRDIRKWQEEKYALILFSPGRTRASRLAQELRDYGIRAYCPDEGELEQEENRGSVRVLSAYLHTGFLSDREKLAVLTESDLFGQSRELTKRRKKKKYEGQRIAKLSEISPGDYVVHESHGIGIYRGIERISTDGVTKDYIQIEYGDGGRLYLPATKLEGIQKYGSSEGAAPKLNKLNGSDWQKTKSRVRHAVKEMAKELVALYSARQSASGHRFPEDSVWQREFEELFPYEETADQLLAIEETKADMESRKIMDRLICGDVGYGKTEVALRAAFKCVQDSRQVAYLAPTTILAQQIYNTFVERMKGFPVNVTLLCRFRSPAQIKKSIADLKAGRADIAIGTHRLLSRDVAFRDLGLLVVDEEQRFGVSHKERIKNLKKNVDVLTLTATPIPRTLHMSLAGIRDLSVLEEPPIDRSPVQTYVMEYNEELIREAVRRELARSGQVYYVHNRVNNIEEVTRRVQALVPEARVAFAHGKMNEGQLEEIMLRFINGEIDVLVSTTIIETGLDIPNANTLIINDADRMGLSQLYQIRGRVGRSSRTAYAFFLYRRGKLLSEESEKRLKAIREFTKLGSGIRIAMRDLEIRGAGNVLGAEQHGHMEAVGYELYCKLLSEAVQKERGGEEPEEAARTQIECELDAYLPDSYIRDETQKLDIYKRISQICGEEDELDIRDEMIDRFGELPAQAENLLAIAKLKALAASCFVTELYAGRGEYRLHFQRNADIRVEKLPELIRLCQGQLRLSNGPEPLLSFRQRDPRERWSTEKTMEHIEGVLKAIRSSSPS